MASTSWQVDQEARVFSNEEARLTSPQEGNVFDADKHLQKAKSHRVWVATQLEQLLNPGLPGDPPAVGAGPEKGRASLPVSHAFPVFSFWEGDLVGPHPPLREVILRRSWVCMFGVWGWLMKDNGTKV